MLFLQLNCAILLAQNKTVDSRFQLPDFKQGEKTCMKSQHYEKLHCLYCQRI